MFYRRSFLPNGGGACLAGQLPGDPGRARTRPGSPREPVPTPDPMTEEDWQAWCDAAADDRDEPPDGDEVEDPGCGGVGV